VEFVTTARTGYLNYSEWLQMRIIACEDVLTPPADPQAVTLSSNSLNSNLLRNLAAENVRLYRTAFIYCETVQNSVQKLCDWAEQRS
jgi:hypothetical protein